MTCKEMQKVKTTKETLLIIVICKAGFWQLDCTCDSIRAATENIGSLNR